MERKAKRNTTMEGLEHEPRFYWIEAHNDKDQVLVVENFPSAEEIMNAIDEGKFETLVEIATVWEDAHIEDDRPW
jgi:hypothetical protein